MWLVVALTTTRRQPVLYHLAQSQTHYESFINSQMKRALTSNLSRSSIPSYQELRRRRPNTVSSTSASKSVPLRRTPTQKRGSMVRSCPEAATLIHLPSINPADGRSFDQRGVHNGKPILCTRFIHCFRQPPFLSTSSKACIVSFAPIHRNGSGGILPGRVRAKSSLMSSL